MNTVNGHRYIGSSVELRERRWAHFDSLKKGKHSNAILQKAYDKYGESSLLFRVLIYCDRDNVLYYEQKCLDELHPEYNIAKDVQAAMRGLKLSEETKQKIRLSKLGKVASEETRRKMSIARAGHTPAFTVGCRHSEETKQKMSLAHMGNPSNSGKHLSEETKLKISKWHSNKAVSEETKQKMSEAQSGEKNAFYGRHHTEETKRKMSESIKEAFARQGKI